jgi:hypothetical protein
MHINEVVYPVCSNYTINYRGPCSSVGIATDYGVWGSNPAGGEIFRTCADRLWGPASCTVGTGSFPEVKRPGYDADHPPPSSAKDENEYSYTSSPRLGPWWPVIG